MNLQDAITEILVLAGGKPEMAGKIVPIFKEAGCKDILADTMINKVLTAGKALKKLGVK